MNTSQGAHDDLTAITGIGPARQRWLRKSLNAYTYEDVAALSVDQIESQLKADGQIVSRGAIEAWLVQAQDLAASADRLSQPNRATEEIVPHNPNSLLKEDGWKPLASFVVEFQAREPGEQPRERRTAAHYVEKDIDTTWPGIESRKLCQWMLDQIREQVELEPEEQDLAQVQPAEASRAAKSSAKVAIAQIRVFQPPQSETPIHMFKAGGPLQGSVKGDQPFTMEVDFELTGPAAAEMAQRGIEWYAQSYVYDRTKDKDIQLGETEPAPFQGGESAYTFALPQASLEHGDYRLWVLVTPQEPALVLPDYVEVPSFQVA